MSNTLTAVNFEGQIFMSPDFSVFNNYSAEFQQFCVLNTLLCLINLLKNVALFSVRLYL